MEATNIAEFNREIRAFEKTIPDKIVTLHKKIVLEAVRRVVNRTPVDTGHARRNWQVTIDTPAEGQLDGTDKEGRATIARGLAELAGLKADCVVWLSNNVDYIEFLEHGSSGQAPAGMLAVTVNDLRMMFKGAA